MYKGKFEENQTPATPPTAGTPAPQQETEGMMPQRRTAPQDAEQHPVRRTADAQRPAPQRRNAPKRKKTMYRIGNMTCTKGSLIFYGIYLALVLIFFIGIAIAMGALKDWLVSFQAAQPEAKSQQVFRQLFADPDWDELYTLARPDETQSDAKDVYAAYMEAQIGDDKLSYIETSAGLSGGKKYFVLHGKKVVATFTLTADDPKAQVPNWQLGSVEVFFSRNLSYNIITLPDQIVTVNGKELDDSYIIRVTSTTAEKYLPKGEQGFRLVEYKIDGLMAKPEVVVTGKDGNAAEMTFDEVSGTFAQVLPEAPSIAQDEYDVVLGAAKAYTEFMIVGGTTGLRKYFNSSSDIYKTITGGMIIRQDYYNYKFNEEVVTDYYKYRDGLFSANILLVTEVNNKYGVKKFEVDCTFIYQKVNGKWVVYDMLNVKIQEKVEEVRLTFKDAEGNVLSSELVKSNITSLKLPAITAPAGQVFDGWYEQTLDDQGNVSSLKKQFVPDASGNVSLVGADPLHPMVLVPQFKEAE